MVSCNKIKTTPDQTVTTVTSLYINTLNRHFNRHTTVTSTITTVTQSCFLFTKKQVDVFDFHAHQ